MIYPVLILGYILHIYYSRVYDLIFPLVKLAQPNAIQSFDILERSNIKRKLVGI